MAEAKLLTYILGLIGYPLYGWLLFDNLDNIKGWILMGLGTVFACWKIFFFVRRQYQAIHREQQEAELRRLKIKKEYQEAKDKEIEQLEKELSLRITGLTPEERRKNMRKDNF